MRHSIVFIGLLVYFGINLADARRSRDHDDEGNYSPKKEWQSKSPSTPQQFTEFTDVDSDQDLDIASRLLQSIPTPEELDMSLRSDLKTIQSLARSVRPVAKNMRRSMHTRRGMKQELAVISGFVKDIMIKMIDASDKFIPHLKPLTKYLRLFVTKIFGK